MEIRFLFQLKSIGEIWKEGKQTCIFSPFFQQRCFIDLYHPLIVSLCLHKDAKTVFLSLCCLNMDVSALTVILTDECHSQWL